MTISPSFNHAGQNTWTDGYARPGRFGFEVVPDDAVGVDDDELQYGPVLRTVLALLFIVILFCGSSKLFEKFDNFSWPNLEKKVEEEIVKPRPQMPKVDEALLAPAPETAQADNPEPVPLRPLFNPDGTMKASFPLPPATNPEDYSIQEPEKQPNGSQVNQRIEGGFNPDQEAYDPAEDKARRGVGGARNNARTIGEYEIFDPERDAARPEWEYFNDPRM